MAKFAEYVLTIRKKDGIVVGYSVHYPAIELKDTEEFVDVMLTKQEFLLLEATRGLKNAIAMVESIKWKTKYWGGVDAETK